MSQTDREKLAYEKLSALNGQLGVAGQAFTPNQACQQSDGPKRDGLRDRLSYRVSHAEQEIRKTQNMQELSYLLDKNPDVARILELIEEIGL